MATLKDVAKAAGVSIATVSYVLNGKGSVSKEVSSQILGIVKEMNYQPSRKAQAMRTGYTKVIGLIVPDITNPFYPELIQSVESSARAKGYAVILVDCQDDPAFAGDAFAALSQQDVDGIIWCPGGESTPPEFRKNCPLVTIVNPLEGYDGVSADDRKGARLAGELVVAMAHRRIAMLNGLQSIPTSVERRAGFLEAAGQDVEVIWEVEVPYSRELSAQARELLNAEDLAEAGITMIVTANDMIAIETIRVLQRQGVIIPDEISVMGFDDIPWATVVNPPLTTISLPIAEMGAEAVDILLQKLGPSPTRGVTQRILDVALVQRESVAPNAGQKIPDRV